MNDLNSNIQGLEDLNLDNLKPNYNIWTTNWGEFLELSEIEDKHLINIIKMLYNNIVSPLNPLSDDYVRWSFNYLDKNDAIEYIDRM